MEDCSTCTLFIEKVSRIGITMPQDFNQRQSDTKLADIEKMIIEENNPQERNILQILQFLTNQSTGIVKGISTLENTLQREIEVHRMRMDAIDKILAEHTEQLEAHQELVASGKGSWKTFTWISGGALFLCTVVGGYAYTVIDNLRMTIVEMKSTAQAQATLYPELVKRLDIAKEVEASISEIHSEVEKNAKDIVDVQDHLDEIQQFTENTKRKRAWRAMR
jgi:ABC-type siderophore export system fused ATPase/permease subunit